MPVLVALVALLFALPALAQDECAETFPARLVDAQHAVIERDAWLAEYEKAKPAVEWFEAHCRFLDELEIVVRKLDDPLSFVCDKKAKGRPKGLTAELVLTYSTVPTVSSYQKQFGPDNTCAESDRATRLGLVNLDDLTVTGKLELMCFQSERPSCAGILEKIAESRARGIK